MKWKKWLRWKNQEVTEKVKKEKNKDEGKGNFMGVRISERNGGKEGRYIQLVRKEMVEEKM